MNKSIYLCSGLYISLGVMWFCSPISFKCSQRIFAFYLKSYSVAQIIFILFKAIIFAYFWSNAPITVPSLKSLSKLVSLLYSSRISATADSAQKNNKFSETELKLDCKR